MFLDWASKLKLLEHDPQSNVLKDFPLSVRKVLCAEVVNYLIDNKFGRDILSSPAHVRWAMETVGQGFNLPIEEQEIIQKCITLYRVWTLEPTKRPKAINEDPQFFTQRLFEHFSMLFAIRASTPQLAADHAILCSTVLDIFAVLGRHFGDKLSVGSWEVFLKLLISIADSILRREGQGVLEPMQKRLASQLLKVLFELWLFSGTRNPAMWDALKLRVAGWTRHMALMMTWKAVCFALSKRMIGILYGSNEGTDTVVLKIEDDIQSIRASDVDVFYAWHRMLHILGDPNESIKDPVIYLAFMGGTEMLVNQFLKIQTSSECKGKQTRNLPPDANTILNIFGPWLFDAIHIDRSGFEEGTAVALKIQSHIVLAKQETVLHPIYLASYCSCLQQALCKEGRVLLAAINSAGTAVFRNEMKGVRALVPSFIYAIHRILTKRVQPFDHIQPAEHVRRSCLQLLGMLMCLPNRFDEAHFKLRLSNVTTSQTAKSFDVSTYGDLKKHIAITLIEALTNETFPPNLEMLLFLMFAWQCEDTDSTRDFSTQSINLIVRRVTAHNQWPADVTLTALRMLSAMSRLCGRLSIGSEQAQNIVTSLCRYTESLCHLPSRPQGKDDRSCEEIAATCFMCISDWLMVDQWIVSFPDATKCLLSSIVVGLTGKKSGEVSDLMAAQQSKTEGRPSGSTISSKDTKEKDKDKDKDSSKGSGGVRREGSVRRQQTEKIIWTPVSERIKEAAHSTLLTLLNHLGNFPTASGPSSVSSIFTEEDILNDIIVNATECGEEVNPAQRHQYMRFFITDDKVIIGVMDQPYGTTLHSGSSGRPSPGLTIMIRDKTGKYAWDALLSYLPREESDKQPVIPEDMQIDVSTDPYLHPLPPLEDGLLERVVKYLSKRDCKDAIPIARAQNQAEEAFLGQCCFHLDANISADIPQARNPYEATNKVVQARMLLSHLGFLSLENRGNIYPINMTAGFFNSLKLLDQVPERECVKVGVLYIQKGRNSEADIFTNEGGSCDYQEFVTSLGWGINVADHEGFIGSLDRKCTTGEVAPYWSDYSTEVVFHVTTLMPNSDGGCQQKKRQIYNVYALVIWTEESADSHNPDVFWKEMKMNSIQIVISPMKQHAQGLYYVKLFTKNSSDRNSVGPIINGMVLSKHILGTLVRETAILAHRRDRSIQEGGITQMHVRKQFIEDLYNKYKKESSLTDFYSGLFTMLPSDQQPPNGKGERPSSRGSRIHKSKSSSSSSRQSSSDRKKDFGSFKPSGRREGGVMMGTLRTGRSGQSVPEGPSSPSNSGSTPSLSASSDGPVDADHSKSDTDDGVSSPPTPTMRAPDRPPRSSKDKDRKEKKERKDKSLKKEKKKDKPKE